MSRAVDPSGTMWDALNVMWPGDELTDTLWHYTDSAGLLGICATKQIHATHVEHLNDKRELIHGEELIADVAQSMLRKSSGNALSAPLASFLRLYKDGARLSVQGNVFVA